MIGGAPTRSPGCESRSIIQPPLNVADCLFWETRLTQLQGEQTPGQRTQNFRNGLQATGRRSRSSKCAASPPRAERYNKNLQRSNNRRGTFLRSARACTTERILSGVLWYLAMNINPTLVPSLTRDCSQKDARDSLQFSHAGGIPSRETVTSANGVAHRLSIAGGDAEWPLRRRPSPFWPPR